MKSKYYKTVFKVTVLSDEPYPTERALDDVNYDITEGHCVGDVECTESKELTGKEMADALVAARSDAGFFQLNEDGEEIDE